MSDETYTKADIDKAVADAIEDAKAAFNEEVDGLKTKNRELLAKVRAAKEIDPADISKLEEENERLKGELSKAQKEAKDATKFAEAATKALENESGYTSKLLTENALNTALAEAGVKDAPMLKAVKAMFTPTAQVVAEGDGRVVKIGDKALTDFVKEWAATDEAKHFISAGGNGGGGAPGGRGSGGGKTMTRTEYNEKAVSDPKGTQTFIREGGKIVDAAA